MEDLNNTWNRPIRYKGILIHPVKMKYIDKFYNYIGCLLIEKNKIPDVKVIKMSYLRFIHELSFAVDENGHSLKFYYRFLNKILILSFRKKFHLVSDGKNLFIKINNKLLSEKDFENIRKIICHQNLIRIPELMTPELEKDLIEAQNFMNKKEKPATLEENIFSFFVATGILPEKIKELTIYQFKKSMERLNLLKSWEVYLYPSLKSGEGDKLQHWLSHQPEKKWYDNLIISEEEINKKFSDKDIYKH